MANNIPLNERIIFALDFISPALALEWVKKLDGEIKFFKVGLQLFLAGWFPVIEEIVDRGNRVMVDLKFFDIPVTVKLAVEQLAGRGITFATVHGNAPIIRAALEAECDARILAVTVLTSFGKDDMREMGLSGSIDDLVNLRARRAYELGCHGVVASPLEARRLRKEIGEEFCLVTPGIRPRTDSNGLGNDDQVRIATPGQAIINGADHLVIGRPFQEAADPLGLAKKIKKEVARGLEERVLL
ncbi:MAG: orotidine-5'-phosphate decarboxylase [Thermodesulfobacteriota bacterium]